MGTCDPTHLLPKPHHELSLRGRAQGLARPGSAVPVKPWRGWSWCTGSWHCSRQGSRQPRVTGSVSRRGRGGESRWATPKRLSQASPDVSEPLTREGARMGTHLPTAPVDSSDCSAGWGHCGQGLPRPTQNGPVVGCG